MAVIFSMSACGKKNTSIELGEPEEMEFSEFDWPRSDIAKLIPVPKSNIGHILWEADYGFVIYVAETTQEEYKKYVDRCWDEGFTLDCRRGDDFFWGDNKDGYQLQVRFEGNNVMWIRMDDPKDEPADDTTEPPTNESISEPTEEPSEQTLEPSKGPLDIPAESAETEPPAEETPTEKPNTLYYSTNTLEQAKKGNSGVFSYKQNGRNYDIYWIIDFNEGYAYYFTYGNGNGICDKVRIDEEGDLNSYITVTYHDGDSSWQEGLCFKRVRQPDRLINSMADGTQYEFLATDLDDALKLRDGMEIVDY